MNRERRKRLAALNLEHVLSEVQALRDEEQEAHDNLPESLQDGERGEAMQEAADALDALADALEDFTGADL